MCLGGKIRRSLWVQTAALSFNGECCDSISLRRMLRIRLATTGAAVAELHEEQSRPMVDSEGPVRALKEFLAARIGYSRFRQRLFGEDMSELQEDASLLVPLDLRLVILDFQAAGGVERQRFLCNCGQNLFIEVERMLQSLHDPNATDSDGVSALQRAAQNGCKEVVHLLLEAGADKDSTTAHGVTAMHMAAARGHTWGSYLEVVRLLLEAGANKDSATAEGETALHMCAKIGQWDIARLLLEARADKNCSMQDGKTALHFSAWSGQLEVVRLLLEAGINKDACTREGNTALHVAADMGRLEVARSLLEASGDIDAINKQGQTACYLAAGSGHMEIVHLLVAADKDAHRVAR